MNKKTLTILLLLITLILFIAIFSVVKQTAYKRHTIYYDVYANGQHKTIQGKFTTTNGCIGIVNRILLPEFANKCKEAKKYEGKIVKIKGWVYKKVCEHNTQCGNEKEIRNIESIKIVKEFSKVVISTDKTEYESGETVKIEIKNNSNKKKQISSPFYTVEKFDNGDWTVLKRVLCPCGFACRMPAYSILYSKETVEYQWNQKEEWCSNSTRISKTISEQVPLGKYRIKSEISDVNDYKSKETIYSNEFTIKGRKGVFLEREYKTIKGNSQQQKDVWEL